MRILRSNDLFFFPMGILGSVSLFLLRQGFERPIARAFSNGDFWNLTAWFCSNGDFGVW